MPKLSNLSRLTLPSIITAFLYLMIIMDICVLYGVSRMATPNTKRVDIYGSFVKVPNYPLDLSAYCVG